VAHNRIGRLRSVRTVVCGDGGRSSRFGSGETSEQVARASIATITGGHVLAALGCIVGPVDSLAATIRHEGSDVELQSVGAELPIGSIEDILVNAMFENGQLLSLVLNRFPPGKLGFTIELIETNGTLSIRPDDRGSGIPSMNIARWRIAESDSDGVKVRELGLPAEYLIQDGGAPGSLTRNPLGSLLPTGEVDQGFELDCPDVQNGSRRASPDRDDVRPGEHQAAPDHRRKIAGSDDPHEH
jgi:predicted dehydrogenase